MNNDCAGGLGRGGVVVRDSFTDGWRERRNKHGTAENSCSEGSAEVALEHFFGIFYVKTAPRTPSLRVSDTVRVSVRVCVRLSAERSAAAQQIKPEVSFRVKPNNGKEATGGGDCDECDVDGGTPTGRVGEGVLP